ncbi:14156_t:CDS:2 [Funneliformis geosporum]|nr:14156_t:CDS:2 [Funneliformis geosporum]
MSGIVSTGQLGHGPILDIFWPELTRDMVSINANKKSYLKHFESKAALLNRKVDFYNSIAYTILGNKQGPI